MGSTVPADRPAGAARGRWVAPLLVVLVAVLVHASTLSLGFTLDDDWLIVRNPDIANPGNVRTLLVERKLWRPLKRISLMADHAIWGVERPAGFHATNVALHAAACLALYAFALRLGLGRRAAALAALLFAVHPVHVEAIANISHRKEPMALLFYLLAFLAYLRARDPAAPRGPFTRTLEYFGLGPGPAGDAIARGEHVILAGACYLLGMLSKEVGAVMFPATILVYELAVAGGSRRARLRWLGLLAVPVSLVIVLFTVKGYLGHLSRRFGAEMVLEVTQGQTDRYLVVLLTAIKAFGSYLALLVWPWPLYLDRVLPLAVDLGDPGVLAGLAAFAVYLAALWATVRRAPVAFFALAWYGLNLLPVINVIPLTYWLLAERFLYVPSVGWALLVALGLEALWAGRVSGLAPAVARAAAATIAVALLVLHGGITLGQNRIWQNDGTLWGHTLRYNPDSRRGLQGYGNSLRAAGDPDQAETYFRQATALYPYYPEPHLGLAAVLVDQDRFEEAIPAAETYACLRDNDDPAPYVLIAQAERRLGRWARAAEACRCAAERSPERVGDVKALAQLAVKSGDDLQALEVFKVAVALRPDADLLHLQGTVLRRLGRSEEALASYRAASLLAPDRPGPHTAMAAILARAGRRDEAIVELEKSLAIDPEQPDVQKLLGILRQ